jgi:hypothetical protein
MKSGNLNFLQPSGTLQDCNGTALPLPFISDIYDNSKVAGRVNDHSIQKVPGSILKVANGNRNIYNKIETCQ